MKVLLLLAALLAGPVMKGGNDGGVGINLPLEIIVAAAEGHLIELPFYGEVYIREISYDAETCSLHLAFETDEGRWIEDTWGVVCLSDEVLSAANAKNP